MVGAGALPAVAEAPAGVTANDDLFAPGVIRIPVGGTVRWSNRGRNTHTVTADEGTFDSGDLVPGATFTASFAREGAFRFFCRYHGARGGVGMAGVVVVGDAAVPPTKGEELAEAPPAGKVVRVPEDAPTIQRAVDRARAGDLVLVDPGEYHESVRVRTPYLTIRGRDRGGVILDGGFRLANGIHVLDADGVALENLTARHFTTNGFYWTGVDGYRGSYLTAYANGDYGVYAFGSVHGRFEHSYAGGHPDSGFYIGQCRPCHAVIEDVLAEDNALGYSGTNAGGDLHIVNSEWRDNMSGIAPNTLDSELLAPQRGVTIEGNIVHHNDNLEAPAKALQYPSIGTGILLAGGSDNVVRGNLVTDHRNYGIALLPNLDQRIWIAEGNRVTGNRVERSGRADLVLGAPAGRGNCFGGNDFRTSLPPAIQTFAGCGTNLGRLGGGELSSTIQTLALFADAQDDRYPHGDWRTQPAPGPLENMAGPVSGAWTPGSDMPGPVPATRDLSTTALFGEDVQGREVTVLGVSLAGPTWWGLLLGVYGYVLPLVLYASWVSIAMWDLVRRDALSRGGRIGWMAAILVVPFLGPILYFAVGRSPIPRGVRVMLVGGGLAVYVVVSLVLFLIGSS